MEGNERKREVSYIISQEVEQTYRTLMADEGIQETMRFIEANHTVTVEEQIRIKFQRLPSVRGRGVHDG